MNEAMTIFWAGIGGVFTGMTMLYLAILVLLNIPLRDQASKDSK